MFVAGSGLIEVSLGGFRCYVNSFLFLLLLVIFLLADLECYGSKTFIA